MRPYASLGVIINTNDGDNLEQGDQHMISHMHYCIVINKANHSRSTGVPSALPRENVI